LGRTLPDAEFVEKISQKYLFFLNREVLKPSYCSIIAQSCLEVNTIVVVVIIINLYILLFILFLFSPSVNFK
jgi:hypothetical protein